METTKRGGVPLYLWMLLGFAVGLGGGLFVNLNGLVVDPRVMELIQAVGQIFLRLLFMLVIPLLFSALAVGVAEMGDLKSLGRVGFKTLAFTIMVSAIAVAIGLGMVNFFQPGAGVDPALAAQLLEDGADGASILALPNDTLIYAIGNQVGVGQDILQILSEKKSNG